METIDATKAPVPNTPIWNTVLRYGAYCGGGMVLFSLLSYLMDMNIMSISGALIVFAAMFLIGVPSAIFAMRHQRDKLDGGVISYGKALGVGVLVILMGMIISGLWNYVMINFVDTGMMARMEEQFMDTWGENMPEEALEEAKKGFQKAGDLFELLKSSIINGAIFGLIISLITAAFMKRDPKPDFLR